MKVTFREIIQQIEDFLFVETKDAKVIPFILNVIQRMFVNDYLFFKKEHPDKPIRFIILKGRQFGFSTLILAILFVKCLLVDNTRAAVISHNDEATKKLFRRVRFFAKTLCLQPTLDKESEREYSFPRTNSYFYIGTAGTKSFGRGDNLTDVHCSEVAFWNNAALVMNGLVQAVGRDGNITIETTANGIGDYFHKLWIRSWNNATAAWKALFYKWTLFPEYEIDAPDNFIKTDYEKYLCVNHSEMTNRKLMWRRWKISEIEPEPGFTAEQVFQREYPLTPREAFISSGKSVFSLRALEAYKFKKLLTEEDGWKIWEKPNSAMSYMGIDSAEGLENKDRSVIDIYNNKLEQVAHWAGWCDTDELGVKAVKMAERYNSYIVCEINNMGIAVQNYLRKHYPKSKQYYRESFDEISKTKVKKIGWRTSSHTTKPKMISDLAANIREHKIQFNNPNTVDECMSFVKDGKGGMGANAGCNDDRVISAGLALQGYLDRPPAIINLTEKEIKQKGVEQSNRKWHAEKRKKLKFKKLNKIYK